MTWYAALTTGAGLGLVYFSGLWWSVRQLMCRPERRGRVFGSRIVRLVLAGFGFFALTRFGVEAVVVGLAGFWLARCHLLYRLGSLSHE